MSGVDELVAFVRRCVDDEQDALNQQAFGRMVAETRGTNVDAILVPPLAQLGSMGDPERVLAEVEAKRRILLDYEFAASAVRRTATPLNREDPGMRALYAGRDALASTVRLLAQPYAGRDGWREEWRPDTQERP